MQRRTQLIRRPAVGWPATMLAIAYALTPALAAVQSFLAPPAEPFVWAALFGLLIGADGAAPNPSRTPLVRVARFLAHATAWAAGFVPLILAVGAALPPIILVQQDLIGIIMRFQGLAGSPPPRSIDFLNSSATRLLADLSAAPNAGQQGARLLIGVVGIILTWIGALLLGRAVGSARSMHVLVLPMLVALTIVAVPGGGGGWPLALGLGLAMVFAAVAGFHRNQQAWEQNATDYSDELGRDSALWASLLIIVALTAAWVLPLWPGNPIARAFENLAVVPSGVAALQQGMERSDLDDQTSTIGLSTLPSLELGQSIAQGPPGQPALRISLNTQLIPGPVPHYWRERVFDRYSGIGWSAYARVAPQAASTTDIAFDGAIIQNVEDLRPDRQLLVGMPDIIAVSVSTRAERFEDGSLAALAGDPIVNRYTVLSRFQEQAPLPARDRDPPDLRPYLQIPRDLPPRVRELALAIAGSRDNDQTRALAIETYLRELPYRYEVQRLPRDGDAVDQFLFDMRSGYCTYYASAMAIMARSVGIPARVATGYVTGEAGPDAAYTIREADAHAWPELYIGERWIPFEPTPVRPLPARGTNQPTEAQPISVATPQPAPWLWILAAILIVLVTAILVIFLVRRRSPPPDLLTQAASMLERYGKRQGLPWPESVSIREYGQLLTKRPTSAAGSITTIVALIEQGRYTERGLGPFELATLERVIDQLHEASEATER